MKKLFLLAASAAVIFVLSNVSFAAGTDVPVVEGDEPCSCCYCTAHAYPMPAPMPYACPAVPQRVLGGRLHALLNSCPLFSRVPAAYSCDPCDPCGAPAFPCEPCVVPPPVSCDPCVASTLPCDPCAAPAYPFAGPRPFRAAFAARRTARFAATPFCPPAPCPAYPAFGAAGFHQIPVNHPAPHVAPMPH